MWMWDDVMDDKRGVLRDTYSQFRSALKDQMSVYALSPSSCLVSFRPSGGQKHLVSALAQLKRQQLEDSGAIGTKRRRTCPSSRDRDRRDFIDYSFRDNVERGVLS